MAITQTHKHASEKEKKSEGSSYMLISWHGNKMEGGLELTATMTKSSQHQAFVK